MVVLPARNRVSARYSSLPLNNIRSTVFGLDTRSLIFNRFKISRAWMGQGYQDGICWDGVKDLQVEYDLVQLFSVSHEADFGTWWLITRMILLPVFRSLLLLSYSKPFLVSFSTYTPQSTLNHTKQQITQFCLC